MKLSAAILVGLACAGFGAGCQHCCHVANGYSDVVDKIGDCEPELDDLYHPSLDPNRWEHRCCTYGDCASCDRACSGGQCESPAGEFPDASGYDPSPLGSIHPPSTGGYGERGFPGNGSGRYGGAE